MHRILVFSNTVQDHILFIPRKVAKVKIMQILVDGKLFNYIQPQGNVGNLEVGEEKPDIYSYSVKLAAVT